MQITAGYLQQIVFSKLFADIGGGMGQIRICLESKDDKFRNREYRQVGRISKSVARKLNLWNTQ